MYHKYLERQIKKYLGESGYTDEKMGRFLKAVSDSYSNYERDRELSEHAFYINELEYQAANNTLKELTSDLENIITERTKELSELAQFPLENPNPIFRVSVDGIIIYRNPVSKIIKDVEYNGKKLSIDDFFSVITKEISSFGSIDIKSNNRDYLFNFKKIEGQLYFNFYGTDVTEKNALRKKSQESFQRLNEFLESTEDAYYIIHEKNKEKDLITSQWMTFFGFDSCDCNDILSERKKYIKADSLKAYNSVFSKLKPGDKASIQYNILNRITGQEFWLSESVSKYIDKEKNEIVVSGRITDITSERLHAIQMQESEERFRNLVEAIPVMVWVSNENNIVTYSNKAFKKLMGFGLEDVKGPQDYVRFVHPEDKDIAVKEWRENISRKKPLIAEYRVKDSNGIYRNVLEKAVPRFFADGRYAGYIGAYFDLTQEKSAQQNLIVEKEKLELLTKNSPDIIILVDQAGVIEYVSPSAIRLLEYDEMSLINSPVSDYICKTCHSNLRSKSDWVQNAKSKIKKFEYTLISKSGKKLWVESMLSLVKNPQDKSVKILMHNRDISSFKQAELALIESEQKYKSIFEKMQLGVMEVDLNDKIQWVNQSFEKMTGYKFNEIKGKSAYKLFLSKESSSNIAFQVNKERRQKKESIYEIEMVKKNKQLFNVVISGSPVMDINGNVRGSVG
ncbi:MAG: PAS domain S-box protein, partial [Ferruginibacter sp.]|nr:PAS domain S-box protein [Ferruginibacter sp.]